LATENVEVVDKKDKSIGEATLVECLERGLLHRAVAVLVIRGNGNLVLQERSKEDHWHPGRWTLSCTGHVRALETYHQAAERELSEELGLKSSVRRVAKILMPKMRSRGLTEWEHVVLFLTYFDGDLHPDPTELEGVHTLTPSEVKKMMSGKRLTPDAKILFARYFDSVGKNPSS
jgi:isopentenyl-diphosphate delta-isomerase